MAETALSHAWPGPQIGRLRDGRLHLQDGPIDLIIEASGDAAAVATAYRAACERFDGLLASLCTELPGLREALPASPQSRAGAHAHSTNDRADGLSSGACPFVDPIARRMHAAVAPYAAETFITPMAAVAGAVAEAVLTAMTHAAPLTRAYVNNGGDIAIHLAAGQSFDLGLVDRPDRPSLFAEARITAHDGVGGVATSGWRGRSFSLGIADAVTVLAARAADADAAATIIANAVDLPGHRGIRRVPASDLQPQSDLGRRLVTRDVAPLGRAEKARALDAGEATASCLCSLGRIRAAALHLQGETRIVGAPLLTLPERHHA